MNFRDFLRQGETPEDPAAQPEESFEEPTVEETPEAPESEDEE